MIRQKALFLSTVITFFVIGIIAGIVRAASVNSNPAPTPTVVVATSNSDNSLSQEAQFNQTINEANQRLEKANQVIEQLQSQLIQQQNQAQNTASVNSDSKDTNNTGSVLTPARAVQIAQEAASGWAHPIDIQPELVNYQDHNAFEVKYFEGGSIYIDENNGDVLFNSLTGSSKFAINDEDAKNTAIHYLKGGGVFRVDRSTFNGLPAYKVIFDVGHRIYVSLGGDILYVELYKVVASSGESGGGGGAPSGGSSHHEEEHEDEDD
ncbi:MAG: PepSY domain-containing protein [Anaerolineae bacterium]|nr:PepSY domain-containing protein [Anaerolineae bacterium]